ncbi:MAG TPA: DUF1232 domain-containing protein [Chloroflexi bacterium]|nr:DUF1232 domain-containing protein [Chloroflexota bacterium]HPO59778.1 DUF1232 domain-containing protein [Anaerolineaceae bacterium]
MNQEYKLPNPLSPEFWRELLRDGRLALQLLRDPRVPLPAKLVPAFVLVYVFTPIDLIPGFIPILGQLDDLAVIYLGLQFFLRMVPEEILIEYRQYQ